MLQGWRHKVDDTRLTTQGWRHKVDDTRLTTQGCNNIVIISWLYRTCWNNFATSLIIQQGCLQIVNSLFQTCWQLGTSSANTTCWRLVGRLATRCEIFLCVPNKSWESITVKSGVPLRATLQYCHAILQYWSADCSSKLQPREQIAMFTYSITVNVPFKLPPEIGLTPTTLLSNQGQTQGLGQSNIYHSCEGVSKS
jgi:hypothetical protein